MAADGAAFPMMAAPSLGIDVPALRTVTLASAIDFTGFRRACRALWAELLHALGENEHGKAPHAEHPQQGRHEMALQPLPQAAHVERIGASQHQPCTALRVVEDQLLRDGAAL